MDRTCLYRRERNQRQSLLLLLIIGAASIVSSSAEALAGGTHFVEPTGWSVGDSETSHLQWIADWQDPFGNPDTLPNNSSALPSIDAPSSMGVVSPGYTASSGGYYSLTGNYSVYANLLNHGGESGNGGPYSINHGTRVFVQTAATLNTDLSTGVQLNTLKLTAPNGASLVGGDNASKLQGTELFVGNVSTPFGVFPQQELLFEFWLPGYTDDFKVDMGVTIHSSFQHLRVDFRVEGPPTIDPDFSGDDAVDGTDFLLWQRGLEAHGGAAGLAAWENAMANPGVTLAATSVPEPSALLLVIAGTAAVATHRRSLGRRRAKGDSPLE